MCGIGHSLFYLLKAIAHLDSFNEYHLIAGKEILHCIQADNFQMHWIKGRGLSYLGMTKAVMNLKCDLAFIPGEVVPFGLSVPCVNIVYDLFPLFCSREIRKELSFRTKLHFFLSARIHFKRSKLILAISEDTKKDIIELCGIPAEKILVTPLGVNKEQFCPRASHEIAAVLKKYAIDSPYFINTSSVWWARKNLIRLIEAFARFSEKTSDCQLVITGNRGASYEKMLAWIHQRSLEKKIKLLEYVDRADVPLLLSGAVALVFPSLHEGFGLPVLEAMSSGCPVITSKVSALPEMCGNAVLFVNPLDVNSIEYAMSEIYNNEKTRQMFAGKGILRANEFSWQKTAQYTLQAFNRVCG